MVSFLDHWDILLDHGLGSCEDAESGQAAFQNPGFGLGTHRVHPITLCRHGTKPATLPNC